MQTYNSFYLKYVIIEWVGHYNSEYGYALNIHTSKCASTLDGNLKELY